MARARIVICFVGLVAACSGAVPTAVAQLDDRVWVGGSGNQQWQVDANWNPMPFPNDPGRMDPDPAVITNVVGANLSVNLAGDLAVDVGATDVTVAALTLGSTGSPVTTDVTSSGGRLVFENFESNNSMPDPAVCAFNCGAALVTSAGLAGVTNTISAVVGINDHVDFTGTVPITLSGGVLEMAGASTTGDVSLRARMPGTTVHVTGGITTLDIPVGTNTEDIPLSINSATDSQGTVDIQGVISGPGRMRYGTAAQSGVLLPHGKVILRGNNTYSGRTLLGRGTTVLANNNAFGTADVKEEGSSEGSLQTGYNIESDNDSRTISNTRIIGQWLTIKGEHSLTWSGIVYQDNRRGWINLLPAGKTLTLSGAQYPNHTEENPPAPGRDISFDGSGKTLVTGSLHNELRTMDMTTDPGTFIGSYKFRGTGTVVLSSAASTYTGDTIVEGANVHFATNASFGNTARIVSEAGAVGVDAGVVSNNAFLSKLNSSASPAADAAGNLVVFDRGGLMLGTGEYGSNLDFTSGDLANASSMSLAAHETGNSYTGTITPANNTYRLGGGSGVLTLPNANQLTGGRSLVVTNGGEVRLAANNNYTGTTSIVAKLTTTLQNAGAADTPNFQDGDNIPNDQMYLRPTLTANSLANGGLPSSIGSATSAADNLHIHGGALKYVGPATSTDRLFTIGSAGATIDASGTGAVNFTNPGALGVDIAEARTGNVNAFATGNGAADAATIRKLTSTADLVVGMPIMSPAGGGIPAGAVITRIASPTDVTISIPISGAFALDTQITFGAAPERTLTLAGTNSDSNTLAAAIPNASDGGVVGVTKSGPGKWVLTGNSTYTGATDVTEGTLLINGNHTGTGNSTVTSAALGGTGSLGGHLVFEEGGNFVTEFVSGMIDPLAIAGNLDLSALANSLLVTGTGTGTSWVIATYAGQLSGTFETITSGFTVDYGTGFNSQITLNAGGSVGVAGDYNENGVVDAADYVLWRNSVGPGSLPNEGGISPGVIDTADYSFWRSRFGATSGAASGVGSNAVPEPNGALVIAELLVVLSGFARRRRVAQ
jgi:fibronectin-binding autotransporter adhesin